MKFATTITAIFIASAAASELSNDQEQFEKRELPLVHSRHFKRNYNMGGFGMNSGMGGFGMNPRMGGFGMGSGMGGWGMNPGMGGFGMGNAWGRGWGGRSWYKADDPTKPEDEFATKSQNEIAKITTVASATPAIANTPKSTSAPVLALNKRQWGGWGMNSGMGGWGMAVVGTRPMILQRPKMNLLMNKSKLNPHHHELMLSHHFPFPLYKYQIFEFTFSEL